MGFGNENLKSVKGGMEIIVYSAMFYVESPHEFNALKARKRDFEVNFLNKSIFLSIKEVGFLNDF